MRLIDADALMSIIIHRSYTVTDYWNNRDRGMFLYGIEQAVNDQPTIDAEPVRHGKWTVTPIYIKYSGCGESFMLIPQNYCPNCGAEMSQETDND